LRSTDGIEEVERVEKELSLDYTDFSNKIAQILPVFNVFHICVIVSSSLWSNIRRELEYWRNDYESTWEEISLFGMRDRDSLYKSR
jgi:hypothetical protein